MSQVCFIGDPWSIPQPARYYSNRNNKVPLDIRLVWYALIHVKKFPCLSRDLVEILTIMGESMTASKVAYIMKTFIDLGYFTRRRISPKIRFYIYEPTDAFWHIYNNLKRKGVDKTVSIL